MAGADPAVIGLRRVGPEVDRELRLDPQQVAPLHRPVVGELLALEQPVDQGARLSGSVSGRNCPGLLGRGQRADHVQIGPPDEHRVRAEVGRLDAQLLQLAEDQLIDPALGGSICVGFERLDRRSGQAGTARAADRKAVITKYLIMLCVPEEEPILDERCMPPAIRLNTNSGRRFRVTTTGADRYARSAPVRVASGRRRHREVWVIDGYVALAFLAPFFPRSCSTFFNCSFC